jgi:hypothetical protein
MLMGTAKIRQLRKEIEDEQARMRQCAHEFGASKTRRITCTRCGFEKLQLSEKYAKGTYNDIDR